MRRIYLISFTAILAGPAMAQSLLEPSSSTAQMQPGGSASINQNVGAMVTLRNLNSVTEALSAQQKRPGTESHAANTADDGAAYGVAQGLRGDMAALNATNSGGSQGKQPEDLAAKQRRAILLEQVMRQLAGLQRPEPAGRSQDKQDNVPPAIDPSAGVDPALQQDSTKQPDVPSPPMDREALREGGTPAGKDPGPKADDDYATVISNLNGIAAWMGDANQRPEEAAGKLPPDRPAIDRNAGVDPGSPDGNLTRAELVTTIVRQFGNQGEDKSPPASGGQSFTELRPSSNWEAGYVNVGKSPDARGNSNPQPLDPAAGLDPETSAGKARGNLASTLANIREAMAQLNGLNQQTDTSKLSREEQVLARLPRDVQQWVRMGLLTMEDAIGVAQAMQTEPPPERLPSKQPLDTANIVQTFVQTASIANAMSTGSTGPGRHAVTYMSAILQQGLTETGTEFASAERTETAANPWSDFAYYSAGQVTPVAPTQSINGATEGIYNGRVLGAFGNGDAVSGTMTMNINFAGGEMDGGITFAGGQGTIGLLGSVSGTGITGNIDTTINDAFGGDVAGGLTGQMFGPRAEEIGGNWNLSVTGGSRDGQTAAGAFAGKQ